MKRNILLPAIPAALLVVFLLAAAGPAHAATGPSEVEIAQVTPASPSGPGAADPQAAQSDEATELQKRLSELLGEPAQPPKEPEPVFSSPQRQLVLRNGVLRHASSRSRACLISGWVSASLLFAMVFLPSVSAMGGLYHLGHLAFTQLCRRFTNCQSF
jgi:hypothetical protein